MSWDLPSLAPGITSRLDVTVANCRVGDLVDAALASSTQFIGLDALAWTTNPVRGHGAQYLARRYLALGNITLDVAVTKRRLS